MMRRLFAQTAMLKLLTPCVRSKKLRVKLSTTVSEMAKSFYTLLLSLMLAAPVVQVADAADATQVRESSPLGEEVERQLPLEPPATVWRQDDSDYQKSHGDRIETKMVTENVVKTIKLHNVVPPIHYSSGEAQIPDNYVALLREVLDGMKDRRNVRLHFVGHSDNVQLRGALKAQFGDNIGLSKERAGSAAEFFQSALKLPPESISYDGMGETQPLASNTTAAGKAKNRRVEVEVWYDEFEEKEVEKQVVVSEKMSRIKVCRVETVCKISYKEGHAKRARIRNLVPPLRFAGDSVQITDQFRSQILQAMTNLESKQNVTLKLIGYSDNLPLTGRDERIYGNALGFSKAQARRAALALQDALMLPSGAIDSDGKGSVNPVASNETEVGRALNRRVEVEFWYDDMLQELSDEPQLCPEDAAAEKVTRTYDPPSGAIRPISYENGQLSIEDGYMDRLRILLSEVEGKSNVRIRFTGYISNERMDRRAAMVYGDDIGLSIARARHAANIAKSTLGLSDSQVEFDGHGYVQSDDVVNSGFVQSDASRVEVRIVYDELAVMDEQDGVDITRLTREVEQSNPYALNLMRISVDGAPIDDPNKATPDVQRCTDVALDKADIQFKFDNLELKPRLNVTAWPNSVRYQDNTATDLQENRVAFRIYNNYPAYIARAEVRIFEADKSLRDAPFAVVPVDNAGRAEWLANFREYNAPGREMKYLLRVYDKKGNYDETSAQTLWVVDQLQDDWHNHDAEKELLVGYGENRLVQKNIDMGGGTIKVYGNRIPPGYQVYVAGHAVPVSDKHEFVTEEILPVGLHTVEVAVVNSEGNGQLYLRDLEFEKSDWFTVGIADLTVAKSRTNGPAALVTQDSAHYDNDLVVDGRIAFYTNGKFGDNWQLTASADTLEGPVGDLFSNFMQKSPDGMFRRIDPDYYYPTYGDDSTVEEGAPTLGKFYVKLQKNQNHAMWGNFKVAYTDNTLAHVDRTLYGANAHLQSSKVTSFGEKRFMIDGYAAQPGTVAGRDEFRGTGGSLYYLRHQDIMTGSDRVRIEVRDKVSGMVMSVKNLVSAQDYDIDYLQGRIVLNEPLSPSAADNLLVAGDTTGGNEAYLVVRYEYSTSFEDVKNLTKGGRTHYWFGDYAKVGFTGNSSNEPGNPNSLRGIDLTLRKSAATWVKAEKSNSEGIGSTSLLSNDGGFSFASTATPTPTSSSETVSAGAYRLDTSIAFSDIVENAAGSMTAYTQKVEGGYSAPGLNPLTDTATYGGTVKVPLSEQIALRAKSDKKVQTQGLETSAHEADVDYQLDNNWMVSGGVRLSHREDHSPTIPLTQIQGDRTDMVVRGTYDSREKWSAYTYLQDTVSKNGNQEDNGRLGAGGAYRLSDRFRASGELSTGDMGTGAKIGTEYLYSDRSSLYLNYALENERTYNGVRAEKGTMSSGFRTHYSDTTSVFIEEKYTHGDVPTGLTHATGVELAPFDHWNFGANLDYGTLRDGQTGAKMERSAIGVKVGYGFETIKLASAVEYRVDNMQQADLSTNERHTWLTKNSLKYQFNPDWRFIGKLNWSQSKSSMGEFYDGSFTEAVAGYGYRPVENDRLNTLFKYTYFYNMPTAGQVTIANTAAEYVQKSHILSVDTLYDLTERWSIGGKYAYRHGQLSQDRVNPQFFNSRANLYIVRADWHMMREWDAVIEGRRLQLIDAQDSRSGALVGIYRHFGDNIKLGAGYNFTTFSDDLTDLDYDHQGIFINLVGTM